MYVHNFVACFCYDHHTVAKLQGSLQGKELDLASVPVLVDGALSRVKESPSSSTWFKDHRNVFTDSNLHGEQQTVMLV